MGMYSSKDFRVAGRHGTCDEPMWLRVEPYRPCDPALAGQKDLGISHPVLLNLTQLSHTTFPVLWLAW